MYWGCAMDERDQIIAEYTALVADMIYSSEQMMKAIAALCELIEATAEGYQLTEAQLDYVRGTKLAMQVSTENTPEGVAQARAQLEAIKKEYFL